MRLWDLKSITLESSVKIDSQISNDHFLPNNLVISSQGYIGNNLKLFQIQEYSNLINSLYSYDFEEHKKRVLYTAIKQSKDYILSQSADGECKLWNIESIYNKYNKNENNNSVLFDCQLR